jgi:hypothetical protein
MYKPFAQNPAPEYLSIINNPLKFTPMKKELELQALPTGKVLFRLTMIGCVLLGCVYGFLVLFNTALEALK